MTKYSIVHSEERTYIFASAGDFTSQIEINTSRISPEYVLKVFEENDVAPEHIQNVYNDLIFKKYMV